MQKKDQSIFTKSLEFDDHEGVMYLRDESTGLRGFIAIHNTNLGPAVGGTRFRHYKNETEALQDALRLSRAMTYKCAAAGVPYGGGKAVLMAPKKITKHQKEIYLTAYTHCLELLHGHFFTGEDVGLDAHDITVLAKHSDSIIGRPRVGGMPARWAAHSVYRAMSVALKERFGSESFKGRVCAIKGLGNVGIALCALITKAGGSVIAADINHTRVRLARKRFQNIRIVPHTKIHTYATDIYAPCALGDEFNAVTIRQLRCSIICGAANNQLATREDGKRLFTRGILYIPDYVANAGGLINVVDELHKGGYSKSRVAKNVAYVATTVQQIIAGSRRQHQPTNDIADAIAEKRFHRGRARV
ncbi:MAG: Glu/Leu/Phe/Val dehydrogenase dimerization domain-containing protein [bacterium]|nr:Glu/Leu/Phe/Val dehydrogenase dimerization domain-containing protein [bacterium]